MKTNVRLQKDITFNLQYVFILIMILFFGFTTLRIGMFGIGEAILLFFCMTQLFSQRDIYISFEKHLFTIFWFYYIAIIIIGYAVNTILAINPQQIKFDLMSYLVILFLCFTFELAFKKSSFSYLYKLLRFIYFGGISIIGALYFIYLKGMYTLLGFPLTYAGSDIFSPFANDYHQFAYFVAPLPFIGLYLFVKERNLFYRLVALIGIALCIKIGLATTSSTLVSSWVITTLLFCVLKVLEILKGLSRSKSIIIVFFCFVMIMLIINYEHILLFINDFFKGDTNGENRLIIWGNAIKAWKHSPIFGLGPGSFSGQEVFFGYEAHNTFLQILTQGGIMGGIAYIILVKKLTKMVSVNVYILCAVVSLIAYGLGINDLRRTVLWFYFILFYYLSLKSKGGKSNDAIVINNNSTSVQR
ncbi:O-antigen ligase family protein [Arthrobacter citreus]|nr:O-antigen ligase family protein [Arthrobacter citreus]